MTPYLSINRADTDFLGPNTEQGQRETRTHGTS